MKKVYRIENLDCAGCAARIERLASRIDGVSSVVVNFMTQRMTVEAKEDGYDAIFGAIMEVCARVEPACRVAERRS